ncbi:MAG TPA: TIM barrel protein [Bryobacteraceae bacterium]|nr:TIM barrel protein [Bryobacteraceae bacterium]
MVSRREFGKLALASAPLLSLSAGPKINSRVNGIMFGAQSYSFRDMSLEDAVNAYKETGLGYSELWQGHLEPKGIDEAGRAKWMASKEALDRCAYAKKLFADAGINIYALNCSFRKTWPDEQIEAGMKLTQAIGTKLITASSQVSAAPRIQPIAKKYGIIVAMHNHDNLKDPDEYAKPESFEKAMEAGPNIAINLDIGHFTAANYDPVEYLKKQARHIKTLHIKDRKKDHGPNVPLGTGDTPIKEVLLVVKERKLAIPAMIEYEYKGENTVAEVKKCFEYCKQVSAS